MECRVCHTTTGPFGPNRTTLCVACDNARARAERLASLVESVQTVDVVLPCSPTLEPTQAYQAMSAITRHVDAIHDNGAVAIVIEPEQIRFRLFAGDKPAWMTDASHRWEPMKVADFSAITDREIDVLGSIHHLGYPTVERLQPARVLRIVAHQRHNQETRQTETLRRRLLAGGVLCIVARDGKSYVLQTGSAYSKETNVTQATPMRVLTAAERDGLVAQIRPLGAGGRFGGGVAVALPEDHEITIEPTGLRRLGDVVQELGVDEHTLQFWMRRLGYDWIHQGHGRWFDDVIVERLREKIPSLKWRQQAPRTRHLWTADEERLCWDGITGRMTWGEVAVRVGRTRRACYIEAGRLKREARLVA